MDKYYDFTIAAVISNHCVFQRNKNISIFGKAFPKDIVKAELFDRNYKLLAANETKVLTVTKASSSTITPKTTIIQPPADWLLQLPPLQAKNGCTLKITCTQYHKQESNAQEKSPAPVVPVIEKTFTDISIGEVWLAGGQSNMEFELQNCTEGPEELKNEKTPNVRFYYTNKIGWMDDHFYEAEQNTCWQTWDSQYKTAWSAVGYFFAKKLAQDLNQANNFDPNAETITVGVIGCNWGGTSASAWMNREALEEDVDLKTYVDEQIEATKGKSIEQQCKEYDEYEIENNKWQEKCAELYAKDPNMEWDYVQKLLGPCPWPGPRSCKNPYRPAGLYECMLKRIIPYTIKGVIWYQGESDDHKPHSYAKLFTKMIDVWRTDWHDPHLPFVFVQLPGNRYKQDKDFKHWCLIREAQQKVHDTVKNAWMMCALDLGQHNDIHPKAKKELAGRLEEVALCKVYKLTTEKEAFSPMLSSFFITQNKIILSFINADDGFELHSNASINQAMEYYKQVEARQGTPVPEDFTGFEVAGEDGVFYPAAFVFSKNTITLTSSKVPSPVYARYGWYNYFPVTVYGKNGLPLAPFRTCDNDAAIATEHAEIQQIMVTG